MLKHNITAASDSIRAFLTTLLGQSAPLRAGTLQAVDPADLQDDASNMLALVPEEGNYAVVLDPGWLPLVAGLKLGVETKVGDEDYDTVAIELAERFQEAAAAHFSALGVQVAPTTFTVKDPGKALPDACFGEENGKIPFFMEWKGQLMHGFVLVAMDRIDTFVDEEALASVPAPTPNLPAPPPASKPDASDEVIPAESPETMPATQDLPEFGEHESASTTIPAGSNLAGDRPAASSATGIEQNEEPPVRVQSARFPDLGQETISPAASGDLGMLADVELEVTVELGRRRMPLSDILRLTTGSVLELEKLVGEPLQVFANNRLIAEGEAVVIDDQFGVRITALASRVAEKKFI